MSWSKSQPTFEMKCIQHILLLFNALFTLTGVILMSVGSTIDNIYEEYVKFLDSRYFSLSGVIVGVGILVLVVSLVGCYSAFILSVAAIMIYSMLMIGIFSMEVTSGFIGYFYEDNIKDMMSDALNSTLYQYNYNPTSTKTIDSLQRQLFCCGLDGPSDWSHVLPANDDGSLNLPSSCCAVFEEGYCIAIKKVGCLTEIQYFFSQSSTLLITTILMVATVQFMCIIFSCKLARQLRRQKTMRDQFKWEVREKMISAYAKLDTPDATAFENPKAMDAASLS